MIEIILLVIGIIYAFRRPKLKRLTAKEFSGVDPGKFIVWHKAEIRAIDIFLWATWGALLIKIGIMIPLSGAELSEGSAIAIMVIILIAWLIGLGIAGYYGSKAKKLRTAAGIKWPR